MRYSVVVGTVVLCVVLAGCGDDQPGSDSAPVCDGAAATSGETCDGADLRGETCVSRGFDGGELACAADCGSFDESACTRCGDGACTGGEDAMSCAEDCFVPRLAFTADELGDDVDLELFAVDATGGLVVNLSGPLAAGSRVEEFAWSTDRQRVAYSVRSGTGVVELYVVPARGGEPVKIAGEGVDAFAFEWAPDSSRIAYLSDHETKGVRELYTVLPAGGGTVRLTGPLLLGDNVGSFAWAPNSSRIAYVVGGTFGVALRSVLPVGGGDVSLFGAQLSVGALYTWAWAPDGSRVAFVARQETTGSAELFTALPAGGGSIKVSGALVAGGNVGSFVWAPDSSRIAYVADQDVDGVGALYTSLPAGGGNIKISGAATSSVHSPRWAPSGARLAYGIDSELFTCPATGGDCVLIDATASDTYGWAPDGSRIAYLRYANNGAELYTSLSTGGGDVRIADSLDDFAWSPDSSRIMYDKGHDLLMSKAVGGDEIAISMVGDDANVMNFAWAPDGEHIAFVVANSAADVHEVHLSPASGGGSVKVFDARTASGSPAYRWAPK